MQKKAINCESRSNFITLRNIPASRISMVANLLIEYSGCHDPKQSRYLEEPKFISHDSFLPYKALRVHSRERPGSRTGNWSNLDSVPTRIAHSVTKTLMSAKNHQAGQYLSNHMRIKNRKITVIGDFH